MAYTRNSSAQELEDASSNRHHSLFLLLFSRSSGGHILSLQREIIHLEYHNNAVAVVYGGSVFG